jgi:hypothetical protein
MTLLLRGDLQAPENGATPFGKLERAFGRSRVLGTLHHHNWRRTAQFRGLPIRTLWAYLSGVYFIEPCIPTERAAPPIGIAWSHEFKFDGYRIQLHK